MRFLPRGASTRCELNTGTKSFDLFSEADHRYYISEKQKFKEKKFLDDYFGKLKDLISFDKKTINKLLETKNLLLNQSKKGKKCMIFGNGGSAAIASHFSVDITKNAKVRCTNYNESDLLTCFSNDFGYDRWVQKTIEFYGNPGDVLIVISASGKSQNMVNACKEAKKKNLRK